MKAFSYLFKNTSRVWMLALAALFTMTGLQAQDLSSAQVPAAVTTAFQKALPGINPRWVAGPSGSYEALFMRDGLAQVYAYDQAGVLQTKKVKTALTSLPTTVQRSIDAGYAGGNVEAAYKVMTRTQEKYFEVQLAQSGQRERLRYNLEGQPIGKTTLGPVASAATVPASKPAPSPTIASAAKPAPAPAAKPAPSPAPAVKTVPKPAPTTMSMRGEATDDTDDLMDEDELDDLLEEEEEEDTFDPLEEEEDDLLEDDDNWEDIDDDL